MKRILTFFLCAAVTLSLTACEDNKKLSSENSAESSIDWVLADEEDFEYEDFFIKSYGVQITKYSGGGENVRIPEKLGGKTVCAVGEDVFSYNTEIKSVYIPDGVMYVFGAFEACPNLTNVTVPGSVISISDMTFWSCSQNIRVKYQGRTFTKDDINVLYDMINSKDSQL